MDTLSFVLDLPFVDGVCSFGSWLGKGTVSI